MTARRVRAPGFFCRSALPAAADFAEALRVAALERRAVLTLVVVLRAVPLVVVGLPAAVPRRADGREAAAVAGAGAPLTVPVAEAVLRRGGAVGAVARNRAAVAVGICRGIAVRGTRISRVPIEALVVPVDESP